MIDVLKIKDQFARAALANYYATGQGDPDLNMAADLARSAFKIFVTETKNQGETTEIARAKAMKIFDEVTSEYGPADQILSGVFKRSAFKNSGQI